MLGDSLPVGFSDGGRGAGVAILGGGAGRASTGLLWLLVGFLRVWVPKRFGLGCLGSQTLAGLICIWRGVHVLFSYRLSKALSR